MENIYKQHNILYFNEIEKIVTEKPIHYANIIRGKKYLVAWINSELPLLVDKIYTLKTKIYWIINGLTTFPLCDGKYNHFVGKNVRNIIVGYGKYCSHKCQNSSITHNNLSLKTRQQHQLENPNFLNDIDKKTKKTKLERYGDENYTNREKAKETNNIRYGKDWFVQTDIFEQKATETLLEHFGVDHNWKSIECRKTANQTKLERYGDENFVNPEKTKQTKLERYGDENYNNSEKAKLTFLENYGETNNMKSEKGYLEWQQAIIDKYGVDHNWKADECKLHTKQTLLATYNMPHTPSWKYTYDNLSFDSSWELAYYIWLKDHNIQFEYPCKTVFEYLDSNNKKHTYTPDFKVGNNIIEIKGPHFIDAEVGLQTPFKNNNDVNDLVDGLNPKYKCMIDNNVKILSTNEIQPILKYVSEKYGKDYLKNFKK